MSVVGRGVVDGYLTKEEVSDLAREGLEKLPLDGKRVLEVGCGRRVSAVQAQS